MMTPGDIDKLQKECYFEHIKEIIDKQQTQIRELTDKKNVVDLDYKEEYYKLQKETIWKQKVKDKIEEIQKEYNKLDKQVDEHINDVNKELLKYYEK